MRDTPAMPDQHALRAARASRTARALDWLQPETPTAPYWHLAAFIAVWFAYGAITGMGKALHNDMTEAWVWGREFQWGYNQHPPFWAWIAGLWFMVFPRTNWPFALLAVLNAAVGLVGAWRLIGLFAGGWTRRAAMMLLLCTPFYTFKADNYNANSIFLSLWPWTCCFFVRAIETRRTGPAALFGMMVGLCMMSKYYAVVLVLTCLGASLAHPDWRRYYRSASPWISIGIAAAMFLPHAVWALLSDAPPIEYALGLSGNGIGTVVRNSFSFLVEITAFHLVVAAVVLFARRPAPGAPRVQLDRIPTGRRTFLTALVFGPPLLTVLFGLGLELKVAGRMTIGVFPLLPLWLLQAIPGVDPRRSFLTAALVAGVTAMGALLASPAITFYTFMHSTNEAYALPQQELAREATRLWHDQAHAPLRFVGGSKFIGNAAAFYSEDRPEGFIFLSFRQAPWVTPEKLHRDGLLALCLTDDKDCLHQAERLSGPDTRRLVVSPEHRLWGRSRAPVPVDVFIYPPHPGD